MIYKIEFTSRAFNDIFRLPRVIQTRLRPRIDALAHEPRPRGARRLSENARLWRLRVGDYRIVYEIRDRELIVAVIRLGHRRDVYRGL